MGIGANFYNKSTRMIVSMVLLIGTMVLLIIKGPQLFAKMNAPQWFSYLAYGLTILLGAIFLWNIYKSKNNTYPLAILRPILLSGLVLGGAYLVGKAFPPLFDPCSDIMNMVEQSNDPITNEYLLNQCLSKSPEPVGVQKAKIGLAHAYLDQVEPMIEAKSDRCDYMQQRLGLALNIAQEYKQDHTLDDLRYRISQDMTNVDNICNVAIALTTTPTVTPLPDHYSLDVLRERTTNDSVAVDFRVIKNNVETDMEFAAENFLVKQDKNSLGFQLAIRTADDPICMIAVVDNSGSVHPGVTKIHDAVQVLNDRKKPGDELGLIIFGDTARVVREPKDEKLLYAEIDQIDGSGSLTALWPGVNLGLETAKSCSSQNRYLIVLTDGGGNVPPATGQDNTKHAQEMAAVGSQEQVNICPIGIRSTDLEEVPLQLLATGCSYFEAARLDDKSGKDLLSDKFQEIIGVVQNFYRISFTKPTSVDKLYLQFLINGSFIDEKFLTIQ
jgi:hypothetical protein